MSNTLWGLGAIAVVMALLIIRNLFGGGKMPANIVLEKIKSGAKIIDVRTPEEFQDGAYPNAVNIPLSQLSQRISEIPKDKPVVVYCLSGARSASAARTLKNAGYTDVINAGGLGDMPR
jgi:phage shock protein E